MSTSGDLRDLSRQLWDRHRSARNNLRKAERAEAPEQVARQRGRLEAYEDAAREVDRVRRRLASRGGRTSTGEQVPGDRGPGQ